MPTKDRHSLAFVIDTRNGEIGPVGGGGVCVRGRVDHDGFGAVEVVVPDNRSFSVNIERRQRSQALPCELTWDEHQAALRTGDYEIVLN